MRYRWVMAGAASLAGVLVCSSAALAHSEGRPGPDAAASRAVDEAADGTQFIGVGLPSTTLSIGSDGSNEYGDSQGAYTVTVDQSETKFSAVMRIATASAPQKYRFPLDLPSGMRAALQSDGSVAVHDADGGTVGKFEVPWAVDANGKALQTRYALEGQELVQTVEFSADTAFPVVADPTWKGMKKRIKAGLKGSNRSTVTGAAGGCVVGAASGAGVGCGPGAATGALGGFVKGFGEGFFKGR